CPAARCWFAFFEKWGLPFPKGQGTAPRRPSPAGSPGRVSKDVANLPPGGAGPSTTNGEPPRFRRWAYHREGSAGAGAGLVRLRSPAGRSEERRVGKECKTE